MQQTSTNSRISIKDEAQDITFSSCGPNLGYDGWHGNWAPPVSAGICAVEMGKPGMKLFLQVSLSDDTSTNKWRNLSGNSQTYQSSNRPCPLLKHVDWWECSYDEGPKGQDIYVEEQLGWCVEASGQKRGCKPHPEISHQQFPSGTQ